MQKDTGLRLRLLGVRLAQVGAAIILGLIVGAVVILITGNNPGKVYYEMFDKSFFRLYYLLQTLTRSTPIAFSALAVIVAWRAGYINLGVEGQMIIGAFTATIVAVYMPGPDAVVFPIAILAGMAAGALYSLIGAFLYLKFNVPLVICTLMMNYIANYFVSYFVNYPLRDPASEQAQQTMAIRDSFQFPTLVKDTTFNLGFVVLILVLIAVVFIIKNSKFGYESKMTGLNREFAKYGGINDDALMYRTMALSGALAALGGICEVFGVKYRYADGMFTSASYAWTGLMAALISSLNPIGSFFSSIFLSTLQVGGQAIQRNMRIPLHLATIIQASITLFVSVHLFGTFFGAWGDKIRRKFRKNEAKGEGEAA